MLMLIINLINYSIIVNITQMGPNILCAFPLCQLRLSFKYVSSSVLLITYNDLNNAIERSVNI